MFNAFLIFSELVTIKEKTFKMIRVPGLRKDATAISRRHPRHYTECLYIWAAKHRIYGDSPGRHWGDHSDCKLYSECTQEDSTQVKLGGFPESRRTSECTTSPDQDMVCMWWMVLCDTSAGWLFYLNWNEKFWMRFTQPTRVCPGWTIGWSSLCIGRATP